MTVNYMYTIII